MSARKPRPAPFVGYQPASRDRPPVTLYVPVRKTELAALLRSDRAVLRKLGERIVADVAKRESEEIDKLHGSLRTRAWFHAMEADRRAKLTEEEREAEDRERSTAQQALAAMMGVAR